MQQEANHNQEYDDEIDLAELVRGLWNGKWLVIGVTFLTVVLAVAYIKVLAPRTSYTASLEISVLDRVDADIYIELNAAEIYEVNSITLLSDFIEDLQSYSGFYQFIKSYGYIERQKDETDEEFALSLVSTAYGDFALVPPNPKAGKDFQPNWVLSVTTDNRMMASQIIADTLALANENVNQQIVQIFQRRQDQQIRENKYAVEDLDFQKQRLLSNYEIKQASKLARLYEQAQIAHSLKLSNGSLSAQSYAGNQTLLTSIAQNEPLYLRGYLALEKEIQEVESRKSAEPFIKELAPLEEMKSELLQDQTVIRANELLAMTPIGTERFIAADYDIASMQYKRKSKKTILVLALAVVLGGMLGVFVLLIRNALISQSPLRKELSNLYRKN